MAYITTPSKEAALLIGKHLLEKNLAACINILDNMTSLYRWQGKVQEDKECIVIAKTTVQKQGDLMKEVKRNHEYDCPCIVFYPIINGLTEYTDWISSEVNKENEA